MFAPLSHERPENWDVVVIDAGVDAEAQPTTSSAAPVAHFFGMHIGLRFGLTDRFQLQRIKQGRAVDTSGASASARTIVRCQLQTLLGRKRSILTC